MKKKLLITFLALAIISIFILTIRIYGTSEGLTIQQLSNASDKDVKCAIAKKVLKDIDYDSDFNPENISDVKVYFGNVYNGHKKEAIIIIQTVPKEAIIAVYSPEGNVYKYKSTVDTLSNVKDVDFIFIPSLNTNMILITDESDQMIGAFEKNDFLRGYVCVNDEFTPVLNIRKDVDAYWNNLWNANISDTESSSRFGKSGSYRTSELSDSTDNTNTPKNLWERIRETSNIKWDNKEPLTIHLSRNQDLSVSTDKETKNLPDESSFISSASRTIISSYVWNDEWKEFIEKEMLELPNREKVAVIEDFTKSPYSLISGNYDKSKILRKDGSREVVDNSTLIEIE